MAIPEIINVSKPIGNSENEKTLLTIRGENASIEGNIVVSDTIEIDCAVKGTLTVQDHLIIQKNGNVKADVKTVDALITGHYQGSMEATGVVEITETGTVLGKIKTDSLIIAKGGVFSGEVERMMPVEKESSSAETSKNTKSKPFDSLEKDFEKSLNSLNDDKLKL